MKRSGFSLIEVMIYTAIFAISSVFLVGILATITKIQSRQASVNEVNQQVAFVGKTIQRLVYDSSLVDIPVGVSTTTLVLRMSSSSLDPTQVYLDSSSTAVYLQEGSSTAIALTDSNVSVDNFRVIKYENAGGLAVVHVDLTLSYNTSSTQSKATRTLQTAISRISAATFDSNILPNANNSYDIGNASNNWKNGYFAGSIGVGTAPVSGTKVKSTGDVAITTSTAGFVFTAPDGTCVRLTINSSFNLATSSVACP